MSLYGFPQATQDSLSYLGLRFVGCTGAPLPHLALQLLCQTQHKPVMMGVFASLRSTNTGDHTGILPVWQLRIQLGLPPYQACFPCQVPTTGPVNQESEVPSGSSVWPGGLTLPSRQYQLGVASLQRVAATCLSQPEQSCFVVSTWQDVEKGRGGIGSARSTRNPDLCL